MIISSAPGQAPSLFLRTFELMRGPLAGAMVTLVAQMMSTGEFITPKAALLNGRRHRRHFSIERASRANRRIASALAKMPGAAYQGSAPHYFLYIYVLASWARGTDEKRENKASLPIVTGCSRLSAKSNTRGADSVSLLAGRAFRVILRMMRGRCATRDAMSALEDRRGARRGADHYARRKRSHEAGAIARQ